MPKEILSQQKPKELTQEQLEGLLQIKINSPESFKDLLASIKWGVYTRFIVTENFNIIISTYMHNILMRRLKVDKDNCLLSNGAFEFNEVHKKIEFFYFLEESPKIQNLKKAAENKIKEFLKSQGVEIGN